MFFTILFLSVPHLYPSLFSLCYLIFQCLIMPPTVSIWFDVSLSSCMCCSLIFCLSLSLSLSLSLALSLSISASLSLSLFSLSLSLYLCFSLSLSLSLSLNVSVSLSLSLSLSFSLSLSVSQSLHLTCLHPGTVSPPIPHPNAFPPLFPQGKLLGILTGGATNLFCITARELFFFLCFFLVHTGEMLIAKFLYSTGEMLVIILIAAGEMLISFVISSHRLPHGQC